ncbi:unnamed protein product [Discosporangium mesarthrocarpum]
MSGVRGSKRNNFADIEKDVNRTLRMSNISALRNVLRCTSVFVPTVGYVQGMNFVCRYLLHTLGGDEEDCFWIFVGMLHRFGMHRLYCPGMPMLRLRFFQLNRLLMWHLPQLHDHFERCEVSANLYATSWFVTLLSDGTMLPQDQVMLVWDQVFLHAGSPCAQWSPVYLVILEMLRRCEQRLTSESRFSELIQTLVNLPFYELCHPGGASTVLKEAGRRFEGSVPMKVQLCILSDQWDAAGGMDGEYGALRPHEGGLG